MNIEELRRLVDETAASATNWHILAIQLQRPPAGPDDPVPAFVAAFHYMLYPITEESGRGLGAVRAGVRGSARRLSAATSEGRRSVADAVGRYGSGVHKPGRSFKTA